MAKGDAARLRQLEAENQILREQTIAPSFVPSSLESEMSVIRQKGRSAAGRIVIQEFADHKNITLWTQDGQRLGPFHPDNAERTLIEFRGLGIILSASQPNDVQVTAYKKTADYKRRTEAIAKSRARKMRLKTSGKLDKLVDIMAQQYELGKEQLAVSIKQQHEVKGR